MFTMTHFGAHLDAAAAAPTGFCVSTVRQSLMICRSGRRFIFLYVRPETKRKNRKRKERQLKPATTTLPSAASWKGCRKSPTNMSLRTSEEAYATVLKVHPDVGNPSEQKK
jgi:hypothetical protein